MIFLKPLIVDDNCVPYLLRKVGIFGLGDCTGLDNKVFNSLILMIRGFCK